MTEWILSTMNDQEFAEYRREVIQATGSLRAPTIGAGGMSPSLQEQKRAEIAEQRAAELEAERDDIANKSERANLRLVVELSKTEAHLQEALEALRKIVHWDDAEKPHKNVPLQDCADLARRTITAIDEEL